MNNNPSSNATNVPPSGNPMQLSNPNVNNPAMNPPNSPMNPGSVSTNPNQVPGGGGLSGVGGLGGTGGCGSGGIITNSGTSSWAQAAGKSLQSLQSSGNTSNNPTLNPGQGQQLQHPGGNGPMTNPSNNPPINPTLPNSGSQIGGLPTSTTSSVTSKQIELLNSMRDALFSTDGWGGVRRPFFLLPIYHFD